LDGVGNPPRGSPAPPFISEVVLSVRRIRENDVDLDGEFVKRVFYCQLVPPGREGMTVKPDEGNKKPLKTEGRYAFSCSA
jgi:hypothetical protein